MPEVEADNLDACGNVAEALGSCGIFGTLLYAIFNQNSLNF